MNWHKCRDKDNRYINLPSKDGFYLVCVQFSKSLYYEVVSYTSDLSEIDNITFPKETFQHRHGFYDMNSEWDYFEVYDVIAWTEIKPYVGE